MTERTREHNARKPQTKATKTQQAKATERNNDRENKCMCDVSNMNRNLPRSRKKEPIRASERRFLELSTYLTSRKTGQDKVSREVTLIISDETLG